MYYELSDKVKNAILSDAKNGVKNPYAFNDENAVRRVDNPHDYPTALRSNFIRDIDKIMNCPCFSRYQDKTQVFSLYKNDDITRRSLHVQFVSRIARTIGKALNLNLELIEAIALGHDIGHTPFGHAGEYLLDELYREHTGRRFFHNVHSVRVLDGVYPYNITLQTLDGIICHNGEAELSEYRPSGSCDFASFDKTVEDCYVRGEECVLKLAPSTLEGCVVRISDIIAYLGKDRQDALITQTASENDFAESKIGSINAEIINNITVNLVENSYGKNYLKLDDEYFQALTQAKKENYDKIYRTEKTKGEIDANLKPMMEAVYNKLLAQLKAANRSSYIYRHHIDKVNKSYYKRRSPYGQTEPNLIVVDYIASMTDDYFIDLYNLLFPKGAYKLEHKGYFKD